MSASYKIALGIAAALGLIVIVYLTTAGGGEEGTGDGPTVADNTPDADDATRPTLRSDDRPGPAARVTDAGRATDPSATTDTPGRDEPDDATTTPPGSSQITVGQPRTTPDGSTGANDDLMASIRALRRSAPPPPDDNGTPDSAADTAADTAGVTPGVSPGDTPGVSPGAAAGTRDASTTPADTTGAAAANPTRPTTTESPTRPTATRTTTGYRTEPGPSTSTTTDTTTSTTTGQTPETYTVEAGDNFFRISEKIYGSDRYWQAIAQANPLVDPARLRIGQELKLPDKSEVVEDELDDIEAPANTVVHTVEAGENLSRIAQQYYDDPTQWNVIYNANRQRIGPNPDRLQAGMKLAIPPALPR